MKETMEHLEEDTKTSLRKGIERVVHEYCEDVECEIEDRCGSPNCEAYGYADIPIDELIEAIMKVIEDAA